MKFSLVITTHDEGEVVDATIQAAFRAVELWQKAEGASKDFEILVVVDQGSEEMREVLRKYDGRIRVIESDFGDVGPARNYAASAARGEYVFFVDGDDLISGGYVAGALKILERASASEEEIVVCPEYCIGFSEDGKSGSVLRMENSRTRERDAFLLFNINLWVMAIAGRREIFLKHKYISSVGGYGHEDYAMNIELTDAGVRHVVVPGEVYFYREKSRSRRAWNDERRATEPYSGLFEPEFWRTFPSANEDVANGDEAGITNGVSGDGMSRLKKIYLKVRENKIMRSAAEAARGVLSRRLLSELPEGVLKEWDEVTRIEPLTGRFYASGNSSSLAGGDSRKIGSQIDGSSRKRREKMMNAMGVRGVNQYCPASVAYLEICRKCEGFSGVDFERFARGLNEEYRDLLMSRIMVQSRGKASFTDTAYLSEWVKKHPELAGGLWVAL